MRWLGHMIVRGYDALDRAIIRCWLLFWRLACWLGRLADRCVVHPAICGLQRLLPPLRCRAKSVAARLAALSDRVPLWVGMAGMSLLVTAISAIIARTGQATLLTAIGFPEYEIPRVTAETAIRVHLVTITRTSLLVAAISLSAALLAPWRHPLVLWGLKAAAAGYALLIALIQYLAWQAPALLYARDPELFDGPARNQAWVTGTLRLLLPVLLVLVFVVAIVRRSTSDHYHRHGGPAALFGDRLLRSLRTHGREPRYRKALYLAFQLHLFVILVLPFLLSWSGCRMRPYGVPKGSGVTAIQVTRIVQKQQKKEEDRKYVLDTDTAISFYVPKIDESEVFDEVSKLTEQTYSAQEVGSLGAGGGKGGGWPNGMENAKVRFIRLQYSGGSWNQNMGYGSDYNMLLAFRDMTGFNIWHETESIRIPQLRQFPPRRAPPFVYLAGGYEGGISLSRTEATALREYCLKMGGMIFADNGGGSFDARFRQAMQQVFPDLPMVEIPHDDVLFQAPFLFPNGAPPLWQISGSQAMGIKYRGRWVLFYHQGNMGAAWRDGHSDAHQSVVSQAYQAGINVIAYAFNQYMQINFGGSIPR